MVFGIQAGTVIIAVATLFGAMIGAVVPQYMTIRRERRNLRLALKSEMEAMHVLAELEPEILPDPAVTEFIPTTVFDSNAGSIGSLTEEEVQKVTRFYSTVFWFQKELQIFEAAGNDKQQFAERNLRQVKGLRENAIEAIDRNL